MSRPDGSHQPGRISPDARAWVGREIGGYRLVSRLGGEGSRGEVYLADDLSLGRRVAVRLLPLSFSNDPERLRRFTEEVGAVSAANHPNIAAVHHIGEFENRRFVVTEFVEGDPLARRIESGFLPEVEAIEIALQASAALRAAHRAGVVHRDVGLKTLMLRSDRHVKVLNFGLAAPDANADVRGDIFHLCIVLRALVSNPGPHLARILSRGCATDESQRFQKVDELHGGLAEAWALIGAYSVRSPADSFPKAIAAARRALELDENLAEARAALALCLFLYEWDWDAAEPEFRRVTESQPGYATGHHWYAEYLMARGRSDEAVASLRRAGELDPLSIVIAVDIGRAYYFGRRFKEARAECQRALDVSPGLVQAIECVAMVDLAEGRYQEAIANYREVIRQGIEAGPPGLMMALSATGREAEAQNELARLGRVDRPAVQLILAKGAIGHRDEAFRDLEAARKERSNNLVYLKTDPRADRMRKDPRWADFMRLAGLE